MPLSSLPGFQDFVGKVNANPRAFSKTRKVRKSEDPIYYDSLKEPLRLSEMLYVPPLPPEVESRLDFLNRRFVLETNPVMKELLRLEYDLIVELNSGDMDDQDREDIKLLRGKLIEYINLMNIPLGQIEQECLTEEDGTVCFQVTVRASETKL